jgi:hypothetical protein
MRAIMHKPAQKNGREKRKTNFVNAFMGTIAVGTAAVMFASCAGGMKDVKPPLPVGVGEQSEISQRCEDMKEIVSDLKRQCDKNDASACTLFNQHEDIYFQVCEMEPHIKAMKEACRKNRDTKMIDNAIVSNERELERLSEECIQSRGKGDACQLFGLIGAFQSAIKSVRYLYGEIDVLCVKIFGNIE